MRNSIYLAVCAVLLAGCVSEEERLMKRADELCRYIPDHELLERSKDYMTEDFYTALDTMFHHLPEHEAMDHEWLYYFVTGNGGTMADYEVKSVKKTDETHAIATIHVRQIWEDGSWADEENDIEEHYLYMEKAGKEWLMSDFDDHKKDCLRHIAISRREQALRDAMCEYLVNEIGVQYRQGELCLPTLLIVAEESADNEGTNDSTAVNVWCDTWVYWYSVSGDTLKTVSGGCHSGKMTVADKNGRMSVTAFEQTTDGAGNAASAERIFDKHYDIYQNMHSNAGVREAVRQEQLREYVRRYGLPYRYYQDYGQDAVALE